MRRSIQGTSCPACGECPFIGGVCEEKVSRGRRFFLLGALAVPIARKIETIAKIITPPRSYTTFHSSGVRWELEPVDGVYIVQRVVEEHGEEGEVEVTATWIHRNGSMISISGGRA